MVNVVCFISIPTLAYTGFSLLTIRYPAKQDTGTREWKHRLPHIVNIINTYDPLVIGTQEGRLSQMMDLMKCLPDYEWYGKGRDDGGANGEFSAVIYKKRCNVRHLETFWLSDTPSSPSPSFGSHLPRVCSFVMLDDPTFGWFTFASTHLDHLDDETPRTKSCEMLFSKFSKFQEPVVIVGDFNCSSGCDPYKRLVNLTPEAKKGSVGFYDTYAINGIYRPGTFHDYTGIPSVHIDWILSTAYMKCVACDVITTTTTTITGTEYASDHFPVYADMCWNME